MKSHIFDIWYPSFKGHGMIAPFTPGWQIADVNPLVIEKSEVYHVTFQTHKDLSFLDRLISGKMVWLW